MASVIELNLGPIEVPDFKLRAPWRHHKKERSVLASDETPDIISQVCGSEGEAHPFGRNTLVTFPSQPSVVVEHRPRRDPTVRLAGTFHFNPTPAR